MIDFCFLITKNSKKSYQGLSNNYSVIEPPKWALILAGSTRPRGFNVSILDDNAEKLEPANIF